MSDSYNGSVELISGITQANNGTYPLIDSSAVQVDENDKRLDQKLIEIDEALKNYEPTTDNEVFYTISNIFPITMESGRSICIIMVDIENQSEEALEFKGQVLFTTTADEEGGTTIIRASYEIEDICVYDFHPTETYYDGEHSFWMYYPIINLNVTGVIRLLVYLETEGGGFHIPIGGIIASVHGKGMAANALEWNGTLTFRDNFAPITVTRVNHYRHITVANMVDELVIKAEEPMGLVIEDIYHPVTVTRRGTRPIKVVSMSDNLEISTAINTARIFFQTIAANSGNPYLTTSDGYAILQTNYSYNGTEQPIDSGRMVSVKLDTDQFASVESIEVKINEL